MALVLGQYVFYKHGACSRCTRVVPLAMRVAEVPADLAICPPFPGRSSTLWICSDSPSSLACTAKNIGSKRMPKATMPSYSVSKCSSQLIAQQSICTALHPLGLPAQKQRFKIRAGALPINAMRMANVEGFFRGPYVRLHQWSTRLTCLQTSHTPR